MTDYLERPHQTLRQGDVVLAPTAVLLAVLEAPGVDGIAAPPSRLGQTVRSLAWARTLDRRVPDVVVEASWSPVLVVSHDCQLEKDFNERIRELMSGGTPEAAAVEQASADPELDPFAVVAPLQPYSAFPQSRWAGIRSGDRIGYFPMDALPMDGGDYAVDLGKLATVSVRTLPQSAKVASLAPTSTAELRYKLAEAYAIRDLSVLTELEAMVGQTILRAEAVPRNRKKSALVLHLDNGEIVHLEVRRPRDELPAEITRTPSGKT
jgi:hypothetical protein